MTRTAAIVLIASFAASGAAFAETQERSERPAREGPRHQMMQEIRDGGVDAARFAELSAERAETRFDRLDADGDGTISREEFLGAAETRAERVFSRMDRDGDGMITTADRRERGERHRRPAE